MDISDVASPDVETHENEKGGKQSHIPVRFDLVDGKAMFKMCAVLHEGAEKYGANNWRLIDVDDHLNHLIMHAYAYLAGDRTDEHLSHIMCRAMFAQAVELQEDAAPIIADNVQYADILRSMTPKFNEPIGTIDSVDGNESAPQSDPYESIYVHFPTWDGSHWNTGVTICTAKGNIRWSTQREQVTCPRCLNAMTR